MCSQATDAWELLTSMLNAARDAVHADGELGREQREAAEEGLAMVSSGLAALLCCLLCGLSRRLLQLLLLPAVAGAGGCNCRPPLCFTFI